MSTTSATSCTSISCKRCQEKRRWHQREDMNEKHSLMALGFAGTMQTMGDMATRTFAIHAMSPDKSCHSAESALTTRTALRKARSKCSP
eukprot:13762406-Ditylum_brightwellii.AAC.1